MTRLFILAITVLVTACGKGAGDDKYVPGKADKVLGVGMGEIQTAIGARIGREDRPSWVTADRWKRVSGLYKAYNNAPLWLEPEGVRDRASALLDALEKAPEHGLSTEAYPIDSIRQVVDERSLSKNTSAGALADADVLLTAAYVAYATDMLMGQVNPKTISQAWHIPMQMKEVDSALVRSLQNRSMAGSLAAMVPQDSAYGVLKREYAKYQKIVASGGWPMIGTASGRLQRTPMLLNRLRVEGYDVADSGTIVPVLQTYQDDHGLERTGKLDQATVRSLDVPADERLKQIASNLERFRWLPRSLGSRYILVNVPAFHLEAYDKGEKKLEMKVVVGAEYQGRSTPVFSDSMEFVVFRPYWLVPESIAAKEVFPKLNSGALSWENFETYNEQGTQRVRQKPGEKNALGLVKFMFPNNFAIYLHDTPQKALFNEADRAASHGCIRVQYPDRLAQLVLGWSADHVKDAMYNGANNKTVYLPQKYPVYIVYFTAYVHNGRLRFGDDLYNRDDKLEDKLEDVKA